MVTIVERPDGTRLEITTVYILEELKAWAREERLNLGEVLNEELKRRKGLV